MVIDADQPLNSQGSGKLRRNVELDVIQPQRILVKQLPAFIGGKMTLAPGADKVLSTNSVAIDNASQLDLADNDMIVHSTAANRAAKVAEITNQLKQGLNATTNSNQALFWTGNGIVTSSGWKGGSNYTGIAIELGRTCGGTEAHSATG